MATIKLTEYVKIGNWLVLRSSLPSYHKESIYQKIKELGEYPEEFGITETPPDYGL